MGLLSNIFGSDTEGTGGLLSSIGSALSENSNALLGYGTGGSEGLMRGAQLDDNQREKRKKLAEAEKLKLARLQVAQKLGIDPVLAEAVPDLIGTVAARKYAPKEARIPSFEERQFNTLTPEQQAQYRQQHFLGTPQRQNAPVGYRYTQDGQGLEAIPGGPASQEKELNTPLPAEIAARFGLANEYFKRYDGIDKDLTSADPSVTGVWDNLKATNGNGPGGVVYRDMKLGSEAMVRMLTGAGRSEAEAREEAAQYLPRAFDTATTVRDKQQRLRAALRSMQREALAGRRSQESINKDYPEFTDAQEGSAAAPVPGGAIKTPYGTLRLKGQ